MQLDIQGHCHPCQYKSNIWSQAKQKYNLKKLKCQALLHVLKKCHIYLYNIYFIVKTDANTLVAQLNYAAINLPKALMTKWLA